MKFHPQLFATLTLLSVNLAQASENDAPTHADGGAVYTMSNASEGNVVLAYQRAANGALSLTATYPTGGYGFGAGLGNQGGVRLSDDNHWLFVVNAGSDELSVFAVVKNGLRWVQTLKSGGVRPVSVASNDELVYVLNAGSDSIVGFKMNKKGQLQPIPNSDRPLSGTGTAPATIQFSQQGRDLVISEKATNKLVVYELDRNGLPESTPAIINSVGQTPFGFSFGKHNNLYVSEAAGGTPNASSVSAYHLTRNGDLEVIDGKVATNLTAACWISITPDGRYLYSTDTGSNAVSGYSIDATGSLSLLSGNGAAAFTGAGSAPIDMAISDNGRFLYTLNTGNHTMSEFRIQADGSLVSIGSLSSLPMAANGLAAR